MKLAPLFLLTGVLESAAAKIYAGFNYGAFWSEQSNVKQYADFHKGFELAKNLTNTPVSFDSARLYTCITAGTKDDPTPAFQAAIDTGTNLLLGMWVSPSETGQSNDDLVENELTALGKAFERYGQTLADLIIGLSVGSEDVYRFTMQQAGVGPDNLRLTIKKISRKDRSGLVGPFHASDFIGMTAYPYWDGKAIEEANATFMATLKDTQQRAGNTSVWISEVGCASADNYQRYWNEFELLQDSTPDQPDWGLLDAKTYQPRIKDLSCGGRSDMTALAAENTTSASRTSSSKPGPTTLSTVYAHASESVSGAPSLSTSSVTASISPPRTTRTTQTLTTTVQKTPSVTDAAGNEFTVFLTTTTYVSATPTSNATLPSANGTSSADNLTACIVMMDLMRDGTFVPVATYAENVSTCTPPPRFTGSPFTMIVGPTAAPHLTEQRSSFDLWAPSTSSKQPTSTTAIQPNGPTCTTTAGVAYEVVILDGLTHTGFATVTCPLVSRRFLPLPQLR
ncbi:hypothetical protein E8E12_003064 [Didymella heteroderae]|uniref:glucan endo-1,3-beta-D-glucosidase n=1 Tax=Didymella heteroderae TaxID=1769908 RepID=A0A9P4WJD4_9PLEO|nr:hypothetical protein E8E12_003064 [Didymella heteroderae]